MTGGTLPELILAQARQRPDALAVRQWEREVSYRELWTRAHALATELRRHGAGPEHRVGICTGRTPDSVVAVVGVLLSGAAYVPLDLAHPPQRCHDVLADAGVALVVSDERGRALLGESGLRHLPVPDTAPPLDLATGPAGPAGSAGPARPEHVAHVLYTSGSTGRPKGVLTTHANVVAFAAGCRQWAGGVGPAMRTLGIASLTFDAATVDLFVPLTAGGSVALAGDDDRADPARLQRFAVRHAVTWGLVTPAMLPLLDPDGLPELEVVMSGGDVVPPEAVAPWSRGGRRFFDIYGPTEATVGQVAKQLSGTWQEPLPIGDALPGQRAYVLDARGDPVPADQEGELHLGGAGVARGYLDRPGLTAQRFLPDPWSPRPGARMYRTGDLVRRRPDGDLEYLGRRDGQVQVRGQRVELGEIEAALRGHPGVTEAAVVAVSGPDGAELVAFTAPEQAPDPAELREFAAGRLAAAMVPRWLERLPRLPLAASGKHDRARLRELAREIVDSRPAAATTATAGGGPAGGGLAGGGLAGVWQQVLGGGRPAPADDFFAAGGSSIAAMRLVAGIRGQLGRDVSVEDVFAARTLAALAKRVSAAAPVVASEDLPAGNPPALAASQRRMWFLDKLAPGLAAYNIVFAERLRGRLDLDALRAALTEVARRQGILRWRIPDAGGQPQAVCDPPGPVPLDVVPLAAGDMSRALADLAARPFDLAKGPLWTATLFPLGADEHVLALAFHHAIIDGWSQQQLYDDLAEAYRAAVAGAQPRLPDLPAQYGDYVAHLAARDERAGTADRTWWAQHLAGAAHALDLPRDRPRPPVQSYAAGSVSAELGEPLDAAVRELAGTVGATVPQVVLAVLGQALHRATGADDLVVGVVTADRALAATQQVVGLFLDIVPMRLRLDDREAFASAVAACRDEYLATTAHPAASLEQLVDDLAVRRDPGRPPLVQVLFNAHDFGQVPLRLAGLAATPVAVPPPGSPFDLTVYLVERERRFVLELLYNRDLFDAARMRRFADDLVSLLAQLVRQPQQPVGTVAVEFRRDGVPDLAPAAADAPVAAAGAGAAGGSPAPATPTERLVAEVWCAVLELTEVRATDNFFDVGGNSLALVAVQEQLSARLGRTLPVVDLFHHPSVRALAAHLDGATGNPELSRAAQVAAARRSRSRRRRST